MKTIKSILAVALCAVGFAAFAEPPVEYLDWDDVNKKMTNATCTAYEVVTKDTATFEAGKTYVVTNDVINASDPLGITVGGTVANPTRLILCDGTKLTVKGQSFAETAGLNVGDGKAIVICGQKLGTGELVATGGGAAAGVGGNAGQAAGTVTINGGTVTANGGKYGSGIGGGHQANGGTVTINGGTVTATGGELAAGIGGGNGGAGGIVTINGGTVTANGGESAAGIGGGGGRSGGTVTINGGTVTTTGGQAAAGIGVGIGGISGGTVTFGGTGFSVVTGKTATVTAPIAQDDYAADHSAVYAFIKKLLSGSESNPWKIGAPNVDDVTAYTNGVGGLVIEGTGDMRDFDPSKDYAPWGTGIAEVEIGEDVTGVGANSFFFADELGSATIPASVTNIGNAAFFGCSSLSNVVVGAKTPPALGEDALENVAEDLTIYVPYGTGAAYRAAPGWSDFAENIVELPQPITAESDEFAVDLRPRVEFEKGKTRIDVVTWSATAWGAVPGSKYTDLGFTNLTTGATGVIAEGLVGENLDDCPLPEKDGEYLLTHSTGDLKSFATFIVSGTGNPVGSQSNPWVVGKTADDSVVAYTNGIGGLVVEGEGDMRDFDPPSDPAPWGTDITEVEFGEGVTGIGAKAFADSRLGSVAISASVTNIGVAAFFGNTSLSNVTVGATTPPALGEGAFVELAEGYRIAVPYGTVETYKSAPDWSLYADSIVEQGSPECPWQVGTPNASDVLAYIDGEGKLVVEGEGDMRDFDPPSDPAPWGTDIAEIEIGEGVTGIGAKAFAGCTSLSSVTVGAMMPPALGADALADTAEDLKIAVPSGAGEAYKAASGWSIYADGIVEQGSPESPWELGGGVTAWVDPALTNIVGLVICNGLPDENRPIDLDALAAAMEKAKYLPAVTPLNALVVTGGDSAAMPAKWVDGNTGMPYGNLEAAVNYGVAAVTPDFGSAEDPVPPRMVVEEGVGEDGGIYTAVVENDVSGVRSNAVWASCAGGLIDVATALDTNVTLKVVAKDAADVDPAVAEAISNRLAEVSAGGKGFDSVAFVDLSVFFNREKQENCELGSPVALHLLWPVTAGGTYGVARMHGGVVQAIPQGAENAVDGEFFTVDVAAGEIVLCVNKFSVYALGSTDGSGMLDPSALGEVKYPNTKNVKGVRQEFLLEKATATWIAKPYDACVFAGWAWTNGTPSEAFVALSENELKGKTLKLKIAAGEKVRPTDIGAVWARIDEDLLGEVTLTPTGLVTESKSYVTATVSGLPSGLRFDKKTLAIGWRGKTAPKDATDKEVKVRVKNASGYTFKQTYLVTVTGGVVAKIVPADDAVRTGEPVMLWGDAALGKVKGSKVYVAGRKASLRATPAKGSIFLGWYEDPTFANAATNLPKGYLTASQSVVVPADGGLHLFARFVELEDWAVGTFDGICYEAVDGTNVESGTVTLTVSSKGKVMGKVRTGGKTYSFFAKTIADAFEVDGRYSFVAYPVMKVGRESREIVISISRNESTGLGVAEILFDEETGGSFSEAVQNGWKLRPSALPAFPTGKAALTLDLDNGLKLKFGAKGVVSFSGKVMGDNGQPVSVSGSTCVLPVAWYSTMTPNLFARVYVYVAPKKNLATGFCEVCDILLKVGASGKFDTATVAPPEW